MFNYRESQQGTSSYSGESNGIPFNEPPSPVEASLPWLDTLKAIDNYDWEIVQEYETLLKKGKVKQKALLNNTKKKEEREAELRSTSKTDEELRKLKTNLENNRKAILINNADINEVAEIIKRLDIREKRVVNAIKILNLFEVVGNIEDLTRTINQMGL
jgi:hypothetical protein